MHEFEELLWEEVRLDILAEAEGTTRPAGRMQNDYPNEYKLTRELFSEMALGVEHLLVSNKQAEILSNMLKSDDEGLDSIQDYLNEHPINAFTLTRLEKGLKFRPNRRKGSITKKTEYIYKLATDNGLSPV